MILLTIARYLKKYSEGTFNHVLLSCYLGVLFYIVATHRGRPPQFVIDHFQILLNRSQLEQNISCIIFRFYSSIYNSEKDLLAHSFP